MQREYFVYILTNFTKTVLYTGITNNLIQRIKEHYLNAKTGKNFTGKYKCYYLLHFEKFERPDIAIDREKTIKGWRRSKKEDLINSTNPNWVFLNSEIMDWPPTEVCRRI